LENNLHAYEKLIKKKYTDLNLIDKNIKIVRSNILFEPNYFRTIDHWKWWNSGCFTIEVGGTYHYQARVTHAFNILV